MTRDLVIKLAKYVAFLYMEADKWKEETNQQDNVDYFMTKIETVKDICSMIGCRDDIWTEAAKIYDFN